jgi:hypothetical protein
MFGESQAPHTPLLNEIRLRQRRYPYGNASLFVRLYPSSFVAWPIAPSDQLRIPPTRTRPSLFGGD